MSFLAPGYFALLALAPLIVWFHMRRREPLEVPSTRLWRLVAEGSRPEPTFRRPPFSLALMLQLLALLLVTLALTQPRLSWHDRGPTVLLVDVGAGMAVEGERGDTRLSAAVDRLIRETRRRDAPWSLWAISDTARPLLLDASDATRVRTALNTLEAQDVATDWTASVRRIAPRAGDHGRIVVATSDPDAARRALDAAGSSLLSNAEMHAFAGPFANVAVADLRVAPEGSRAGRWSVEATVVAAEGADRPGELTVAFLPDETDRELELASEPLRFTLAGVARVRVDVDGVRPGILVARIDANDAYDRDDAIAVRTDPAPSPARVAVHGPDRAASPLRDALEALGTDVVDLDEDGIDVAVVAGAPDPFENRTAPPAVLWFGSAAGVDEPTALTARDAGVTRWSEGHPLAANAAWNRLEASAALTLPVPVDATTVVDGVGGPLVAARTTSTRREAWFAFDPTDPAWFRSAAFLAAVGDALDWTASEGSAVETCRVATPCTVPLTVATHGGRIVQHGRVVASWPTGDGPWPARIESGWTPTRSGIASWTVGDRSGRIAVQAAPSAAPALEAAATGAPRPSDGASLPRRPEIRTWVLAAVLVMVLESLLAGMRTERFFRRDAWRAAGRVARRNRAIAISSILVFVAAAAALSSAPWPLSLSRTALVAIGVEAPEPWPERRVHRIEPRDADGIVNVEERLADARALAATLDDVQVLWSSDVPATRGSLASSLSAPDGVPVAATAPPASDAFDVRVDRVELVRPAYAGDVVELTAVVTASETTNANLRVQNDGQLRHELDAELQRGSTLVRVPIRTPREGDERWRVAVSAPGDAIPANDVASTIVDVRPPPRVWIVTSETDRGERFGEALDLQGLSTEVLPPFTLPAEVGGYAGVNAVVLANVPALEISTSQQEVLERWVRDRGGALIVAGGERAFGPGGYFETALDRLSPLSAKVPRDAPEVAMLFVLDRSGSMQQQVGGATRLSIAKEATLTATELLGPSSQVAIVVFDEQARVLLSWTPTDDLGPVEAALADLVPGGGTALYPGLASARDLLDEVDSATRHVVLMTDGLSQPGDLAAVTRDIAALQTTVSTVAIGQGADVERIREIAEIGGGAAHVTRDFRALPGILAQEAMLLSGDPVVRETVTPVRTDVDPGSMEGLPQTWPPLSSFVETTPKAEADVLLVDRDEGRPLLASWRYGAGRVLAFTAHAVGPWSNAWAAVDAFPRWWGQWLRWSLQPTANPGLEVDVRSVGDAWSIIAEARDDASTPLEGARIEATWHPDGQDPVRFRLAEQGSGRYEGDVDIVAGAGTLTVRDLDGEMAPRERRLVHSYRAALASRSVATAGEIASATGGELLSSPDDLTVPPPSLRWGLEPSWSAWLSMALALYLVTLANRYLPGWWRGRRRASLSSRATSSTPKRADRPLAG